MENNLSRLYVNLFLIVIGFLLLALSIGRYLNSKIEGSKAKPIPSKFWNK